MISNVNFLAIALLEPFYDFVDASCKQEHGLRNIVVFPFQDLFEAAYGLFDGNVFARAAGELFCDCLLYTSPQQADLPIHGAAIVHHQIGDGMPISVHRPVEGLLSRPHGGPGSALQIDVRFQGNMKRLACITSVIDRIPHRLQFLLSLIHI